MDKELELIKKALEIGEKYGRADISIRIEVGKVMSCRKRRRKRKSLRKNP